MPIINYLINLWQRKNTLVNSLLLSYAFILTNKLLPLLLVFFSSSLLADHPNESQQQVKTALVFKISQFIEWTEKNSAEEQFNICVVGEAKYFHSFQILESRTLNNKPIKITFLKHQLPKTSCQILYLAAIANKIDLYKSWDTSNLLTISDYVDFSKQHGIIELAIEKQRIVIKINLKNAKKQNISILSPLLQVSTIVSQ